MPWSYTVILINFWMTLGDGGLGENAFGKNWIISVEISKRVSLKKKKDVSDSLLPSEMNADKPILTVNLFCCLKASDM